VRLLSRAAADVDDAAWDRGRGRTRALRFDRRAVNPLLTPDMPST
jgi:hypothetical protein